MYVSILNKPSSVQIMACRLSGAKPLSKPMMTYCQSDHRNKLQWSCNQNKTTFMQENLFENIVCKMSAILSCQLSYVMPCWCDVADPLISDHRSAQRPCLSCVMHTTFIKVGVGDEDMLGGILILFIKYKMDSLYNITAAISSISLTCVAKLPHKSCLCIFFCTIYIHILS